MKIKGRQTKKCPRCGNICLLSQAQCDDCGLYFARVEEATNKEGKRRLARGQKEQVIYVNKCKDVKRWKLILFSVFLGLFGAHYFYVGKWKKGLAMLTYFFAVLFMGVIFNAYFLTIWDGRFYSIFGPLTGIYVIVWLWDIVRITLGKFKMPVSIISEKEEAEFIAMREQNKLVKKAQREEKKALKQKKIEEAKQ